MPHVVGVKEPQNDTFPVPIPRHCGRFQPVCDSPGVEEYPNHPDNECKDEVKGWSPAGDFSVEALCYDVVEEGDGEVCHEDYQKEAVEVGWLGTYAGKCAVVCVCVCVHDSVCMCVYMCV